ncbi:MAG: 50S ribosomal protein L30 [Desulfobulbus sp.]|jgi:large subunit ribosomal protein L30
MNDTITYTQVKSSIGSTKDVRATLKGLGLLRMHMTVTRKDTPELRGMLNKVQHLVRTEEKESC